MLKTAGVQGDDWFPMIRGRLVTINDEPVGKRYKPDSDPSNMIQRELNLSHSRELPPKAKIVAGKWVPDEPDGLSVEEGLAKTLGLKLGDKMVFDVGGQLVSGHITTLRKVDWGSMRVNFFVMFPRADMGDLPLSYISAFKAPAAAGFDNRLAAQFPNVTAIDVSATIAQVQGVLDQVIHAVELLFAFALVAGPGGAGGHGVGHARGAGARVRGHARGGRVGHAAGPRAARRAAGRRRAGRAPCRQRGGGGGLGPGHLGVRVPLESAMVGAVGRRGQRWRAGAGRRLVEPARGAGAAGDGDLAACGAGMTACRRRVAPAGTPIDP